MKLNLFGRLARKPKRLPPPARLPLSETFPAVKDLKVHLETEGVEPFAVDLHDLSIRGAKVIAGFELAPLAEGSTATLDIHHPLDGWRVRCTSEVRSVDSDGGTEVVLDLQFVRMGELFSQLDDALGRFFNRRTDDRVKPKTDGDVHVKIAREHHRLRGVAHDLSPTGVGVRLPLAQAAILRSGSAVSLTVDIPELGEPLECPAVVRHGYREGADVVLGVEFDLEADSSMRERRRAYMEYIDDRRYDLADLMRRVSKAG